MNVTKKLFGHLQDKPVYAYTLKNDNNVELTAIDYGCIITKLYTPDENGKLENIVLGHDNLEDYLHRSPYFGAVVGRVAGRIGGAKFELNGKTYTLAQNENDNHLHGGLVGYDKVIWDAEVKEGENEASIEFSYLSVDGEEGYPGNLQLKVTYTLNNDNEFTIQYDGISDETTLLNITNHSYFNLSGELKRDILDHTLTLKSDQFLELQDNLLPSGELIPVEGTTFDFRSGRKIRTGVESDYAQNKLADSGYDHPFVLSTNHDSEIYLEDAESGRTLTIETDEKAVVVYTSNMLPEEGEVYGVPSRKYLGICLETQGYPDAPNHPHFPNWILEKDQKRTSVTKYKFGTISAKA
nr:aldose epimerase family protein [Paenibacillus bovis]